MVLERGTYLANLDKDYTVIKCKHIGNHWNYIYKLPLNNYAVVQYEDDRETIIYSSFNFERVEALHEWNRLNKTK